MNDYATLIDNIQKEIEINMNELLRAKVLRQLGRRGDNYSYSDRVQSEYIYAHLVERCGTDDFEELMAAMRLIEVQLKAAGPRRINKIYQYLKLAAMTDCGRYDFSTSKIPMDWEKYDKGWKV